MAYFGRHAMEAIVTCLNSDTQQNYRTTCDVDSRKPSRTFCGVFIEFLVEIQAESTVRMYYRTDKYAGHHIYERITPNFDESSSQTSARLQTREVLWQISHTPISNWFGHNCDIIVEIRWMSKVGACLFKLGCSFSNNMVWQNLFNCSLYIFSEHSYTFSVSPDGHWWLLFSSQVPPSWQISCILGLAVM